MATEKRLIETNAFIEALENADADVCEAYADNYCDWGFSRKAIEDLLQNIPTAEAVPVVHGQWEWTGSCQVCSICGEEQYGIDTGRYYCPNCGAKMDGDVDNENS